MSRSVFSVCVLAATVFMRPALAVDGTTLIDQTTVLFSGGFPYKITQSGSYRLSSNLIATHTTAINISASDVTLDLNGFTISCLVCSGVTGVVSSAKGTTLENGTVTGFAGSGGAAISLAAGGAKADHITATGSYIGIAGGASADLTVTNSNAGNNTFVGVSGPTSQLTVLNSVISGNGQDGIDIGTGLITGNTIAGNGHSGQLTRGGVIVFGGVVNLTNNVIADNAVFGTAVGNNASAFTVGFGSNTFAGNTTDVSSAGGFVSMKNNACSGGVC
jgi:hypothetical protein